MNRNWRNKYHKEVEFLPINEDLNESSESDPEDLPPPSHLSVSQITRSSRFSIWLSVICYSFALSIVIATFYGWATTTEETSQPTVNQTLSADFSEEVSAEFEEFPELSQLNQSNLEENLQQIIQDPSSETLFRERLNSLYLVILGAVAGYLHAVRQINPQ
jgi:hypothetical protein